MKVFLVTLFLLVSNLVAHTESIAVKDTIAPDHVVVYKTIDTTNLSLHVFNPEGHKVTDNAPAIVFFFGGGWSGGTPKQFYEQARYFAQKGFVALSAEYRVNKVHGTTPFEAVTDAKSVIRWVRQQAEELGVNPNKIIAAGGSAGGHLALCTDVIDGYEEDGEDLSVSSKPNAIILYNPVLDTTEKGYGMAKVSEDRKTAISPNHHIKKGIAPTIVFHGTADKTVPFENAERFNVLMKEAGNICHLESYEDQEHGFFNGSFFRGARADTLVYNDILEKSYAFLASKLLNSNDVKPANLFSNHMVLQQEMNVPIWGTASVGETITVKFAGQEKSTAADENGNWKVILDPLVASKEGKNLEIIGKNKLIITDVLVGEVWICSGQSNMQMNVSAIPDIQALVAKAQNIRSFEVPKTVSLTEKETVAGRWSTQVPISAIGFSFAYFLEQVGEVPVGIIHSSWGSSSIEAWMPKDMTNEFDYFEKIMNDFDADTLTQSRIKNIIAKQEKRTREEDIFIRRQPNILYNAMIKPLVPYAVRGVVWYQGERNTRYLSGVPQVNEKTWFHRVIGMKEYGDVLNAWILRYRQEWQNDDMQFMVVMLPGYVRSKEGTPEIDPNDPTAPSWAWMRESQLKALQLPHTSVINTIDLGDLGDIHPKDKLPIGQRLALEAAKETLGQNIVSKGPIMKTVDLRRRTLVVRYTNADGLKTTDGKSPAGFWIADDTMQWQAAKAKIKGQTVVLSSKEIKKPLYVRYAFSGKPDVNLVNEANLPAYPFRTDNEEK